MKQAASASSSAWSSSSRWSSVRSRWSATCQRRLRRRLRPQRHVPPRRRGPPPRLGGGVPRRPGRAGLHHLPAPQPGAGHRPDRAVLQGARARHRHHPTGQPVRRRADVAISTPDRNSDAGPYLDARGLVCPRRRAATSWATSSPPPPRSCNKINTDNLSTVLGRAGPGLARRRTQDRRRPSTPAPSWPACSTDAQRADPRADSFAKFTQAVAPAASGLNNLNAQINAALPAFNAEEADYEKLLNTLIPFANRLAALLSTYHPDIATILDVGRQRVPRPAGPAGLTSARSSTAPTTTSRRSPTARRPQQAARRQHLRVLQHVHPLQRRQQPRLQPDRAGRRAGCRSSQPLQQALAGRGSAFNCSSPSWPPSTRCRRHRRARRRRPRRLGAAHAAANSAGRAAANQVYGILGTPRHAPSRPALGGIISSLLGGRMMKLLRHFPPRRSSSRSSPWSASCCWSAWP